MRYTFDFAQDQLQMRRQQMPYFHPDVILDRAYPERVAYLRYPVRVEFRCEAVFWTTSRSEQRGGLLREDRGGRWALLTTATSAGHPLFHTALFEDEISAVLGKWLVPTYDMPNGCAVKLLAAYYAAQPRPRLTGYEARVINYEFGGIFADHPHLRELFAEPIRA